MVKSNSSNSGDRCSSSVAPFLLKCYEMVDDESNKEIVSWSKTNNSFIIWDESEFSLKLLPKYWKHNNFSSFIRQLNIYGFKKVDTDRWEFANEGFIRGQKLLLRNITRRKNSSGLDQRKSSQQKEKPEGKYQEIENFGLWKEVETLKIDRNALRQELVKIRQQQDNADNKLLVLRERLQGMETNQQQMMSFIVMAMQSPGFFVKLLQPKEHNWRSAEAGKTNMLQQNMEDGDTLGFDGMIVKYQPPMNETVHALPPPESNSETSFDFDLSDGMKDFFANSDLMRNLMHENDSFENPSSFILPDLPDDGLLEQLLLSSSFSESVKDDNLDNQEATDSLEMENPSGIELRTEQVEKHESLKSGVIAAGAKPEKLQNMDLLTKQMGHLASDNNNEVITKK